MWLLFQVVWATSNSIGCGAFRCANLQNAGANWLILVCNYGPAYVMTSLCFNIMLLLTIILLAVAIWLDSGHIYLVIPVPNAPRTGAFVSIMRVVSSLI